MPPSGRGRRLRSGRTGSAGASGQDAAPASRRGGRTRATSTSSRSGATRHSDVFGQPPPPRPPPTPPAPALPSEEDVAAATNAAHAARVRDREDRMAEASDQGDGSNDGSSFDVPVPPNIAAIANSLGDGEPPVPSPQMAVPAARPAPVLSPERVGSIADDVVSNQFGIFEIRCPLLGNLPPKDDLILYSPSPGMTTIMSATFLRNWFAQLYIGLDPESGLPVCLRCPWTNEVLQGSTLGYRALKTRNHEYDVDFERRVQKLIAVHTKRIPRNHDEIIEGKIGEAVAAVNIALHADEDDPALRAAVTRHLIEAYHKVTPEKPDEPILVRPSFQYVPQAQPLSRKIYSIRRSISDHLHPRFLEGGRFSQSDDEDEENDDGHLDTPRRQPWEDAFEAEIAAGGRGAGSGTGGNEGGSTRGRDDTVTGGGDDGTAGGDGNDNDGGSDEDAAASNETIPSFIGITGRGPMLCKKIMEAMRDSPSGYSCFPRTRAVRKQWLTAAIPTWRQAGGILHGYRSTSCSANNILNRLTEAFTYARGRQRDHSADTTGADGEAEPPYQDLVAAMDSHNSTRSSSGARQRAQNAEVEHEHGEARAPLGRQVQRPMSQVAAENRVRDEQRPGARAAAEAAPGRESMEAASETMTRRTVLDAVQEQQDRHSSSMASNLFHLTRHIVERPPAVPQVSMHQQAVELSQAATHVATTRSQFGTDMTPETQQLMRAAGAAVLGQLQLVTSQQQLQQQQLQQQQQQVQDVQQQPQPQAPQHPQGQMPLNGPQQQFP